MTSNNRQELFTLYAANIANDITNDAALKYAKGQLEYFNSMTEPPQTEETGLFRDEISQKVEDTLQELIDGKIPRVTAWRAIMAMIPRNIRMFDGMDR